MSSPVIEPADLSSAAESMHGRGAAPLLSEQASWRDPGLQAFGVLALVFVAGGVMIGLGWSGAARTGQAPLQTPWLVSGGITGMALIALSLLACNIHLGRRLDASHQAEFDRFVRETAALAEGLRNGDIALPTSVTRGGPGSLPPPRH